jgi:hypothetical protein
MNRYLFIILLSFQGLLAQVQFETKVSKTTLGLNERLRVDFAMNIDGDNFSLHLMVLELLLDRVSR